MSRKIFGKLHRDDSGVSLVEIIISILILMVVFVPLINSMLTATRVNSATSREFYATQAADNIMTEICYLGYDTVLAMCADDSTILGSDRYSYRDGRFVYSNRPNGTYREGTEDFLVSFTVTKRGYNSEAGIYEGNSVNAYSFADTSDFALPTTAQIIPGVDTVSHIGDAYEFFVGEYQRYKQSLLRASLTKLEEDLRAGLIDDEGYEDIYEQYVEEYSFDVEREQFMRQITKSRKIVILPAPADIFKPGEIIYTESYEFRNELGAYRLSDDPLGVFYRDFPDYSKDISGMPVSDDGTCQRSVYLLYTPTSAHLTDDKVTVYNCVKPKTNSSGKVTNMISVFIVIQNGSVTWNGSDTILVSLPEVYETRSLACYNGNLALYSQARTECESGIGFFDSVCADSNSKSDPAARLIKETLKTEERLYYVELSVADPSDPTHPLVTLNSTME